MTRERPNQPDRTLDIRYYPLESNEGEIEGGVATMRDLTAQKARERQLQALDRLLRHNLHNELNLVIGYAETIAEQTDDDLGELADGIVATAERVLAHADKEREIVEVLSEPSTATSVDVAAVVERAVDRVQDRHPAAEVSVDVPSELWVSTIREVERAIEELVENAVIHANADQPEVTVRATPRAETVEVAVVDNGPGIPPEEREVIVGDEVVEPLLHSSGMGLWLVNCIVTQAGGGLRIEDDEDGSVVTVVVPRGHPDNDGIVPAVDVA